MNNLKKHLGLIILITASVLIDIFFYKGLFYTVFLFYGLLIRFFLSKSLSEKPRKILAVVVWIAFLLTGFLLYYSNHYFPRGPMFDTGDVVCLNDGHGPCQEEFIEDPRYLDIPEWGKFFKGSEGELLWFGLLFAGITLSVRKEKDVSD